MTPGLVSVIMGVHNEKEEYLVTSINSICRQSYENFEFIIIDDNSNDQCSSFLKQLASDDNRIRLFRNNTNLGLTKSLNFGLEHAQGEYVARMDADDYSTSDRFEKQVNYLNKHLDVDVLGGGVVSFGDRTIFMSPMYGYTNEQAQCELFFQSTLCHPSVIIRKSFIEKYNLSYNEEAKKGQDYELWERCSVLGRLSVMADVVLYYRIHERQITSTHRADQDKIAKEVRLRRLHRLGIIPSDLEYNCHMMLLGERGISVDLIDVKKWMKTVIDANEKTLLVNSSVLYNNLQYRFNLLKVRNKLFSVSDIPFILKLIIMRIMMHIKLRINSRLISNTIKMN